MTNSCSRCEVVETLGEVKSIGGNMEVVSFQDCLLHECALQASRLSLIKEQQYLWLGNEYHRMLLSHAKVQALVNHLQRWLDAGTFKVEEVNDEEMKP